MGEGFFQGVNKQTITLSTGLSVDLPFKYYDFRWINAVFPASYDRITEILPSEKLKPLKSTPGRAVISFSAFEYHNVEGLQPYNEFTISIPVQYEPSINFPGMGFIYYPIYAPERYSRYGVYIMHLPVTIQDAVTPGVEIFGFPASLGDIEISDTQRSCRCTFRSNGKDVLFLEVKKVKTVQRRILFHAYTVKNGKLVRSLNETEGKYGITTRMPGGASFELGEGPIADQLRELRIGKTTIGRIYATNVQSMLHAPSEYLDM